MAVVNVSGDGQIAPFFQGLNPRRIVREQLIGLALWCTCTRALLHAPFDTGVPAPVGAHVCTCDHIVILMTPVTIGHDKDTSEVNEASLLHVPTSPLRSRQHPGCDGGTTTTICIVALQ